MGEWKEELIHNAEKFDFPIFTPYYELTDKQRRLLWEGNQYFHGINDFFKMLEESDALHTKLMENVEYFRDKMLAAGFDIKPTQSAICAVMLYDAKLSQEYAARLLEEGIYVTGFYYPVVPKGQARIRVQLSAAHERHHLDKAIAAFIKVGRELGTLK